MRGQKSPGGQPGQGDGHRAEGVIVYPYHSTNLGGRQPQCFDAALSLSLDTAIIAADAHDLAARDHWAAAQHHAVEALGHADLRDRELVRIVDLESRIPEDDDDTDD